MLSSAISPVDDDLKDYFRTRIVESLSLAAFEVVADPSIQSPTPTLVHEHFTSRSSDFVEVSKALGRHLFAAQQKVASSPGLLVVVRGEVDTGPCLAVLKLQKEEGVRLERTGSAGQETYSVEHLRQLMLTNTTRVFKVALFESAEVVDSIDVHGSVSDKQRAFRPEKQVADFFLHDFLGCRVRDNPAQTTSLYFHRLEKFINTQIADPEKRATYHRALLTDMASKAPQVQPKRFAEDHIDEADQPSLASYLQAEGVSSSRPFDKDIELITSRLKEEEYILRSGIRVRGSAEALAEHAEISKKDDDQLEMLIVDRLKSVNGTGARRSN
ncbi:MAG: hypothetical protein QOE65_2938 [Solirubrobacteraceae bacterium]|nr:hypothetical protein [Solirubrobacteraceae bacterium]